MEELLAILVAVLFVVSSALVRTLWKLAERVSRLEGDRDRDVPWR